MSKNFIAGAIEHPGTFRKAAKSVGMSTREFARHVIANKKEYSTHRVRQAELALRLMKLNPNN